MSKIGRKAIDLGSIKVEVKGQEVHYSGPNSQGIHEIPDLLSAQVEDNKLFLRAAQDNKKNSDVNRLWGLHRALLANKVFGAAKDFERQVKIVGLGYKAIKKGEDLEFSLGYSHKIDFSIPKEVTIELDKPGQMITVKAADKAVVGKICREMCALRPVEPYKGTGVYCVGDIIRRKAGKAKA